MSNVSWKDILECVLKSTKNKAEQHFTINKYWEQPPSDVSQMLVSLKYVKNLNNTGKGVHVSYSHMLLITLQAEDFKLY